MRAMSDVPAKLRALRARAGISMDALAREMGYRHGSSIQRYFADDYSKSLLPLELARKFAAALGGRGEPPIEEDELLALAGVGRGAPSATRSVDEAGLMAIDELDVRAGAGNPQMSDDDSPPVLAEWKVPAVVMRGRTSAPDGAIKIITVSGDSMEPDLRSGQRVFVDLSDTVPSPPGVFVLWDGVGITIKQVEVVPYSDPLRVVVKSRNPHYGSVELAADQLTIHGRVIGKVEWT